MNAMRIAVVLIAAFLHPFFGTSVIAQSGRSDRPGDVVPGVVVIKLKRTYAGQVNRPEQEATSMLGVFSGSGVNSLVRAFT